MAAVAAEDSVEPTRPQERVDSAPICDSAIADSAADPPLARRAQSLYHDALHSCFSFLTLPELNAAAISCPQWLAAVRGGAGGIHYRMPLQTDLTHVRSLCASSLLSAQITSMDAQATDAFSLLRLLSSLPNLRSLAVSVQIHSESAHPALTFSPRLRSLQLTGWHNPSRHMRRFWQVIIDAASRTPTLERLWIAPQWQHATPFDLAQLDLSPLLKLERLEEFTMRDSIPTARHIEVLRQMTTLRTLRLESKIAAGTLQALAAVGHSLRNLERVDFETAVLSTADITALQSFPALTALPHGHRVSIALSALGAMCTLPVHLRELAFIVEGARTNGEWLHMKTVLDAMLPCSFLGSLHKLELLMIMNPTVVECDALFEPMRSLRVLDLNMIHFASLSFLRWLPTLEQLRIAECSNDLRPGVQGDLRHILALPLLAHLHICEDERRVLIWPDQLEMLMIPSAAYPRLRCFQYALSQDDKQFCVKSPPDACARQQGSHKLMEITNKRCELLPVYLL